MSLKIVKTKDIMKADVLVVTRVKDFDPETNEMWKQEGNKSYPHDGLRCHRCGFAVVMSDNVWGVYSKKPDPKKVVCGRCIFEEINRKTKNEKTELAKD